MATEHHIRCSWIIDVTSLVIGAFVIAKTRKTERFEKSVLSTVDALSLSFSLSRKTAREFDSVKNDVLSPLVRPWFSYLGILRIKRAAEQTALRANFIRLPAAKHSAPICEMFRESVVRIAFGASDIKGAISLHRVLLQSPSARGSRKGGAGGGGGGGGKEKILLVSPILPECKLRPRRQVPILSQRVSFAAVSCRLFAPSSHSRTRSFHFPEKYRRALTSPWNICACVIML